MMRHGRSEVVLPRLVRQGKMIVKRWNNRNIYIAPKLKGNTHYDHGLGVTEGLVRFWRSDMTGTIIPSRFFRGLNCIPEWGIHYGGKLLLYEFCTADNFRQRLRLKVGRYRDHIWQINARFQSDSFVVFVLDVPRERIDKFISGQEYLASFFFVDYATFKSVPIGQQFKASIYIWGGDRKEYALSYEP